MTASSPQQTSCARPRAKDPCKLEHALNTDGAPKVLKLGRDPPPRVVSFLDLPYGSTSQAGAGGQTRPYLKPPDLHTKPYACTLPYHTAM